MKIVNQYNHNKGLEHIQIKDGIFKEIKDVLTNNNIKFGNTPPKQIKAKTNERFNQVGWADKVKIGTSNLTINFLKKKVGICFQIGNVARTYADILKLSQLNKKGIIDVGVMIVPQKNESKLMGANYAQFERLVKELAQFKEIIPTPIIVIGLSN
jgi:hypothetical protein